MSSKVKLYVLVGMIAAGKSTYSKKKARSELAAIVNDDAIILGLHGGHYDLFSEELRPLYKMTRTVMIRSALMMGLNVVVDSTNLTVKRRRNMIQLAKECNALPVAVCFHKDTPAVHARRRYEHESRGVSHAKWFEIARYHDSIYEPVTKGEGFFRVIHLDKFGRPRTGATK